MSSADLPSSLTGGPVSGQSSLSSPASLRPSSNAPEPSSDQGLLERLAGRFTALAERWLPDAYVFALVATLLVVGVAWLTTPRTLGELVDLWGGGFWELIPFTLQMALIIITGYVLATSRPVYALIRTLAGVPSTQKGAVAWVAFLAMASSWLNWGFSLIFSAMLAREVARRPLRADYRALAASSFLGLGSVWAQGLSGSAALQMATPSAMPEAIRQIVAGGGAIPDGVISLNHTIFLWQSLLSVGVEAVLVTWVMWKAAPTGASARTADELGIPLGPAPDETSEAPRTATPGEWLEHSWLLTGFMVLLAGAYLLRVFWKAPSVVGALNLNTLNLIFLTGGVLLHGTPARLMRAFKDATPGVWGILLQFPFYAGIAAVIAKTQLNEQLAQLFVQVSTRETFPALIAVYSAVLGVFVPSGGSKWVIEAPYVMQAAHTLKVHLGWMVAVYDLGEALANLLQPFWMLPILGLFGLKARAIMGYTFLVFLVLAPVVLVLVTVLGATLAYPL